ncbi:MAG: type I methionyl aminopeptidase [Desulfohalobiaceae bacterium]|nr:type I methionyl aminopeptidase [Desulfohalobiaceae bacterium]
MKIGRNDTCPCGSGLKYKKCCMLKQGKREANLKDLYYNKHRIRLKDEKDIQGIRNAGVLVMDTLKMVREHLRPGLTTEAINTLVHDFTVRHQAVPAPLNYNGFPKSVCISINEEICHGIPGPREIQEGDIVNIDVTSILDGYYADANQTFLAGSVSDKARKIVAVALESLRRGLAQIKPGNRLGDIGWAIQDYAEDQGCSVVREMVGHGIGFDFHEPPQVPHFGKKGHGLELVPGMVFTVEPMINLGGRELKILDDKWTAVTRDRSLSAQFEQTVVVTREGFESLTPF